MVFFTLLTKFFSKKKLQNTRHNETEHSSDNKVRLDDTVKPSFDICCSDETLAQSISSSQPSASSLVKAFAVYNGGYRNARHQGICLRIANGGAGQTGLIQAWADAFIQHMVATGYEPFEVAWYLGDTTESLGMLSSGVADVALTYNTAAEKQLLDCGDAVERIYAFRDHFLLVGPASNPAKLDDTDDILTMFSKIIASGNVDVANPPDPDLRPATRFLSRFDKSATNIKESQIFTALGQVPWALNYSKWYHQYPRFPREALQAAALLSEYTLSDQGSWLCAPQSITSSLKLYKVGGDDPNDPLLNPARLLRGARAQSCHKNICKAFMKWVANPDGGQKITREFSRGGHLLYSAAP